MSRHHGELLVLVYLSNILAVQLTFFMACGICRALLSSASHTLFAPKALTVHLIAAVGLEDLIEKRFSFAIFGEKSRERY